MNKGIYCAIALSMVSATALAQPVLVQATFTGESSEGGVDISGFGAGTLDGDNLELSGRLNGIFDGDEGVVGFSEVDIFTFDFSNNTGSVVATGCEPLPGFQPDCADPDRYPETFEWETVSGTPTAFTTTIDDVTVEWVVEDLADTGTTLLLEEPVNGAVHSGIGNLRGWAFNPLGVERIEIWIDGQFAFTAPSGGYRPDVGEAFPELLGAVNSGFSLAYGYSNLSPGEHMIEARAIDSVGDDVRSSSTFTVVAFDEIFIFPNETVDVGSATLSSQGDQLSIEGADVAGQAYNLLLEWRTAEQGFEIIEID